MASVHVLTAGTYIWNSEIYSIISRVEFFGFWKKKQPNSLRRIHVYFSGYILHVGPNPNPARQRSAYYNQNPKFSGQNRLLDNCLSYIHLIIDILTPDTICPLVFPFDWLFRTHSTEKRSQSAERGEDAARSQAAAQRRVRRTSICPWARARGREDAAGPERITAPIAAPFHTHIWQSYSGSFPHITQLDTGRGNFFQRSVRKDSET